MLRLGHFHPHIIIIKIIYLFSSMVKLGSKNINKCNNLIVDDVLKLD